MSTRYVWNRSSIEPTWYLNDKKIAANEMISTVPWFYIGAQGATLEYSMGTPGEKTPYFKISQSSQISMQVGDTHFVSAGIYFGENQANDNNGTPYLSILYAQTSCTVQCVENTSDPTKERIKLISGDAYAVRTKWGPGSSATTISGPSQGPYPSCAPAVSGPG